MDPIASGAFPGADPEDNPTCDAAELVEKGDIEGARELLMDALLHDLRCIDAHAHLGSLAFDQSPKRAMAHYEIGIRIGELSLPRDFHGVLVWGRLYNRPFLRCLHGFGLLPVASRADRRGRDGLRADPLAESERQPRCPVLLAGPPRGAKLGEGAVARGRSARGSRPLALRKSYGFVPS